MANSKFRCAGCREFKPMLERRRIGTNQGVCSDECARIVMGKRPLQPARSSGAAPPAARRDDPPTAVRMRVITRDGARCRFCGLRRGDHLHHINYRSEGVDHQEHNLISLCHECHDRVHSNKRVWKPLLLGVIWLTYQRRPVTVLALQRRLEDR